MTKCRTIWIKIDGSSIKLRLDSNSYEILRGWSYLLGTSASALLQSIAYSNLKNRPRNEIVEAADKKFQNATQSLDVLDDVDYARSMKQKLGEDEFARRVHLLRTALENPAAREQITSELFGEIVENLKVPVSRIPEYHERKNWKNDISINFALSGVPKNLDPIQLSFYAIREHLGLSKSSFLRNLYLRFLSANLPITKEGRIQTGFDFQSYIMNLSKWRPYGWKAPIELNLSDVMSGKLNFSFLNKTGSRNVARETIVLLMQGEDVLAQTLPFVCTRLGRNRSELFQLLYLNFLNEFGLLNKDFLLRKNWRSRLVKVSL